MMKTKNTILMLIVVAAFTIYLGVVSCNKMRSLIQARQDQQQELIDEIPELQRFYKIRGNDENEKHNSDTDYYVAYKHLRWLIKE